jgi:hypothetical protein
LNDIQLISSGVSQVLYDEYSPGGNLYYFKSSTEDTAWEEIIADDLKEQDKQISQPNPDDYSFIFGYSYKYRKAVTAYQDKVNRDELR